MPHASKNLPKALIAAAAALILTGCAHHKTAEISFNSETGNYEKTTFSGWSFFNKTAVSGLVVGRRSGKESTTLQVSKASTETQTEAITAVGEALGAGLAAGVKKSIVP